MTIERVYRCAHCDKTFKREVWYKRHECDKMKRYNERFSTSGLRAHELHNYWVGKVFGRKRQVDLETFCKSKYYSYFKNLADFTLDQYVVNPYAYLDYLIAAQIEARFWASQRNLNNFRETYTEVEDGVGQAQVMIDNARAWCQRNDCQLNEFLDKVSVSEVLNMVRECRIMPWPLLAYEGCLERLLSRFDDDQLNVLDSIVDISNWLAKSEKEPDMVSQMVNRLEQVL